MVADGSFWYSVLLYLYRPNLINTRLIGAKILKYWICFNHKLEDILEILKYGSTIEYFDSIFSKDNSLNPNVILEKLLNQLKDPILILRQLFRKQSLKSLSESHGNSNIEYDLAILIPTFNSFAILPIQELPYHRNDGNLDHVHINIKENDIAFRLSLIDGFQANIHLELSYLFDQQHSITSENSCYWFENVFEPKIEKWIKSAKESAQNGTQNKFEGSIINVSVESYCQNYNRLKEKYVQSFMNIWSKVEKTDPIKFIYEDIAIAAYLITLWEEEMEKFSLNQRQTFADIGCGNGLLVYILTLEGYNGYGVDIRKRNIWDVYGNDINLIEMKIDLFDQKDNFQLAPCDWMIGNHSDELTPWIIFMAASSSSFTRAFILPCCCYDFDGFKFQRTTEPNKSQYQCYIDFLERLCHQFGFKCFRDKLRIPSTKRICLVCYDRTYLDEANLNLASKSHWKNLTEKQMEHLRSIESQWQQKRRQIVEESLKSRSSHRLREKIETVRNCTGIDQNIKEEIIKRLASALYERESHTTSMIASISFQEAIRLLDDNDILQHLKNQCGGLQTFIRNHKHIFTINKTGICFQTKEYLSKSKDGGGSRLKTKECWFHKNHPRGCPLNDDECSFRHSSS